MGFQATAPAMLGNLRCPEFPGDWEHIEQEEGRPCSKRFGPLGSGELGGLASLFPDLQSGS